MTEAKCLKCGKEPRAAYRVGDPEVCHCPERQGDGNWKPDECDFCKTNHAEGTQMTLTKLELLIDDLWKNSNFEERMGHPSDRVKATITAFATRVANDYSEAVQKRVAELEEENAKMKSINKKLFAQREKLRQLVGKEEPE